MPGEREPVSRDADAVEDEWTMTREPVTPLHIGPSHVIVNGEEYVPASRLSRVEERLAEQERTLARLRTATRDFHRGCECGGSGVVSACHDRSAPGCCGACETTACECCQDLLVALWEADALARGERPVGEQPAA